MQLISSSLDDMDQINYSPQMSLELFNLALALALFTLQYSATLWTLNRLYAFVFSVHLAFTSSLALLSFAAVEVLYKFQLSFANGIKLDLTALSQNSSAPASDATSKFGSVLFNLPFVTGPLGLQISFVLSLLLLLASSMPIYAYGVYQYRVKLKGLRAQFARYLPSARAHFLASAASDSTSDNAVYANANFDARNNNGSNGSSAASHHQQAKSDVEYTKVTAASAVAATADSCSNASTPPPLPSQPPPTPQTRDGNFLCCYS